MSSSFAESKGKIIVESLIQTIAENKVYLSELDGAIGDGDHGINMDKGFGKAQKELSGKDVGLSESLQILGRILVDEIGGSMGPLYGTLFRRMARASKGETEIDALVIEKMLVSGLEGVQGLGNAQVGDKTLIDTLFPAVEAFRSCNKEGKPLNQCLDSLVEAAQKGKDSTIDMVAKVGRASRLGERSRGVLDPVATSCYLLLQSFAQAVQELIKE